MPTINLAEMTASILGMPSKLTGAAVGYRGICCNRGIYVDAEDAPDYAWQQLGIVFLGDAPDGKAEQDEFKKMATEWYFSGNWVKEYE